MILDPGTITVGARLPELIRRPTPVQLFRFSAATWNAHRIHYDKPYAQSEGYPDILVQSHLHASFLAQMVCEWAGAGSRLTRFRWENRSIAVPGDTLTCRGIVTSVNTHDGDVLVDCELEETNGQGALCAPAWATVSFPREGRQ